MDKKIGVSEDWVEDCMKFYGKVLTGKNAHWCPDWDHLPIDDTCHEMKYCSCGSFSEIELKKITHG